MLHGSREHLHLARPAHSLATRTQDRYTVLLHRLEDVAARRDDELLSALPTRHIDGSSEPIRNSFDGTEPLEPHPLVRHQVGNRLHQGLGPAAVDERIIAGDETGNVDWMLILVAGIHKDSARVGVFKLGSKCHRTATSTDIQKSPVSFFR